MLVKPLGTQEEAHRWYVEKEIANLRLERDEREARRIEELTKEFKRCEQLWIQYSASLTG